MGAKGWEAAARNAEGPQLQMGGDNRYNDTHFDRAPQINNNGKLEIGRRAQATHKTRERELVKQHPSGGRTQQMRRELEAKQHHARRQGG